MRHAAERRCAYAADDCPAGVASLLHAAQTFARRCAVADDDKAAQPISGAVLPAEQTVRNKAARAGERDEQQIAEKDHPARKVHHAEHEDEIDIQHHAERAAENDVSKFVDEAALRLRLVDAEQPEEHGVHRRYPKPPTGFSPRNSTNRIKNAAAIAATDSTISVAAQRTVFFVSLFFIAFSAV